MSRRSLRLALAASVSLVALGASTVHAQFMPPAVNVPAGESAPGAWPFRLSGVNLEIAPVPGSVYNTTNQNNLSVVPTDFGPYKWTDTRHNQGDFALVIGPADTSVNSNPPLPPDPAANNFAPSTGPTTHGWRVNHAAGFPIATVRVNGRDNLDTIPSTPGTPVGTVYGTASFNAQFAQGTSYNMLTGNYGNGGNGASDLVIGIAGAPAQEGSMNVAAAFFPYSQGWIGGFVDGSNIGPAGEVNYLSPSAGIRSASPKVLSDSFNAAPNVTWQLNPGTSAYDDGRAVVNLGTGRSNSDGMLFVTQLDDDSNLEIAAATPNTTGGWNVAIRNDGNFDTTGATLAPIAGNDSDFGYLYIPYDANNLVGGRIDGSTGNAFAGEAAGSFTLTRTAAGVYELEVTGETGSDGMLILSNADGNGNPGGLADRSFLSYEYNSGTGKFVIQAREGIAGTNPVTGGTFPLTDTDFYFAYVDFSNPMTPVAQSFTWNVATGNYKDFGNWSPNGRPVLTENATIGNNGTAEISFDNVGTDAAMARDLSIGTTSGSGTVLMTAGELYLGNRLYVGDSGTGTLTQDGGLVRIELQGSEDLHIGNQLGSVGVYNLNGGELAVGDDLLIGANGTGTLNINGGVILRAGYTVIGDEDAGTTGGAAATGTLNMTAGGLTLAFGDMEIGDEGTGTANISGGVLNVPERISIGNRALGTGALNVSGGAIINTRDLGIGFRGQGTLKVTGDTAFVTATQDVVVEGNVGSTGRLIAEFTSASHTTINANRDVLLNGGTIEVSAASTPPATGAHTWNILVADADSDSNGALVGTFAAKSLPGPDSLGRRYSVLYENRNQGGVGVVDAVKVGLALPGDLDFDSDVDFNDAFELTNNYGLATGATWRQGDFFDDGAVDFNDAFEQTNNFGATYATTEGDFGDNRLTVVYNPITGLLTVDGAPGEIYKSLIIESASGLLKINQAGWLGATGVGFTQNSPSQQGFASNTALGHTFLIQDGYAIGTLIDPGVSQSFLLQDLTIRYGIQGQVGTRTGDFIPEPSTFVLAGLGLAGLAVAGLRRRKLAA
ncbi:MAG: PEP-CTERM sorting domain-containing protein [Pirellulales bacterium]|nr:PEP-CTERM sorting domain-containing protein [Pirellulales bacterium]